jgi:hypothetical protein
MLHGYDRWGGRDWDKFESDLISATRSLKVEGELPLWMPYRKGGHDALADPESLWASPLGVLALVCGRPVGIRLFAVLCAAGAALGVVALGAFLGVRRRARCASGVLYACGPLLGLFTAGGVPTFMLGFALLPWLVMTVLEGSRRSLLLAGGILALDLWGGDVNYFLYHSLFVVVLVGWRAVAARRARLLLGLAIVFPTAVCLTGPKLIPVYLFSQEIPRRTSGEGRGAMTPALLGHALLNRDAVRFVERPYHEFVTISLEGDLVHGEPLERVRPETAVDWIHIGGYLGLAGTGLGLWGLLLLAWPRVARQRRRGFTAIVVASTLFLWLSCGANAQPSAWNLLHSKPLFSSLRSPARLWRVSGCTS